MKFINFVIVRFSILLMGGILVAHYFPIDFLLLIPLLITFGIVVLLWILYRKQLIQPIYFGIVAYLCFLVIGYFSYQIKTPHFLPDHYTHTVKDESPKIIQLKILQSLKPDKFNEKYFAEVKLVDGQTTSGKILVNIPKDSTSSILLPDELLLVYSSISDISPPLNPHQFDYSHYMELQGVYNQLRITPKEILQKKEGIRTLLGTAQRIRTGIVQKLQDSKLKPDERAIIQALVLGEKKDIDKDLYQEYAAAGAVHILAVSGLHVGILYVILAFMFQPLKRGKYGKYLHSIVVVLLLWAFAMLSGLSPSVTRAVTMFSCFAFATLINRRTNSINTLFLSLMPLLIINPFWLFQVGFQLSYFAVFFIVWLQPIVKGLIYSKIWIIRKIWGIASVTLCAQIGVLPLSLYYFHQFPGLFLITNIVILPFLTVLMCGGILIVLLAIINILPDPLSEIYNTLIGGLNGFIHWIAMQEDFLFKNIHFSILKVLGTYFLLFTLALLWKRFNFYRLTISLSAVAILISIFIYDEIKTSPNHLIIFHKRGKTLFGYKTGKSFTVFKQDSLINFSDSNPVNAYRTAINIKIYSEEIFPKIVGYKNRNMLVVDSSGLYPKQNSVHTVILSGSPRVNLNRLIDSLQPKQIVVDGNNYKSYTQRWKETCKLKKLPFHSTTEQGAFVIR